MLIRRRIELIRQLVEELRLTLSVKLVRSAENRADVLTRVPKEWLRSESEGSRVTADRTAHDESDGGTCSESAEPAGRACAGGVSSAAVRDMDAETGGESATARSCCGGRESVAERRAAIAEVHERAGHPGIHRTLYFARRDVSRRISRSEVRSVVEKCDVCCSIDPAPARWDRGSLGVTGSWEMLAIDITHYQGRSYLTIIDCGPSRFSISRALLGGGAFERPPFRFFEDSEKTAARSAAGFSPTLPPIFSATFVKISAQSHVRSGHQVRSSDPTTK